jgi:hypothetical protein
MQPICTHKICLQSSTPSHAYPIIRLPREYKALAGKKAQIYQTEQEGELVFVVKVDKLVDKSCLPTGETIFDSRLSALESQIAELKSLLLENENQKASQSPLFRQSSPKNQWARPDSNRRPPPCEDGGFGD